MSNPSPLWLASASARRSQLLEEAGLSFTVRVPDVDDGRLQPSGTPPASWALAMAYLKARRVAGALRPQGERGIVLGADTVCSIDGLVLGQPGSVEQAADMIRRFRGREHQTISGVCLIDIESEDRWLLVDAATVRMGHVEDDRLRAYLDSGLWRGKAGGYNLFERLEDGWPIEVSGDPGTVVGLPMQRLLPLLRDLVTVTDRGGGRS